MSESVCVHAICHNQGTQRPLDSWSHPSHTLVLVATLALSAHGPPHVFNSPPTNPPSAAEHSSDLCNLLIHSVPRLPHGTLKYTPRSRWHRESGSWRSRHSAHSIDRHSTPSDTRVRDTRPPISPSCSLWGVCAWVALGEFLCWAPSVAALSEMRNPPMYAPLPPLRRVAILLFVGRVCLGGPRGVPLLGAFSGCAL